ncbi:uncharacterized protein LOC115950411 [Quercus lobata]|uniref:uncharacterized protein LOC115950411 n=1 Tax=Quercus lobata TaxID=97700 RepID=UPI001247A982|nr:uncharacterized protein LOC115950411 [Quercus lobata]
MVAVMESIGFADLVVVDAKGSVGGLCVMWKAGVSVQSVEHNNNLIAVKVADAIKDWIDEEKVGSRGGESSAPNFLKELFSEFGAIDLGFSGSKFTWARGKWGCAAIKRRLDRGVSSISWRLAFPKASVSHLGAIKSDHAPILLDTNPDEAFAHRPFRFKAAWIRDDSCVEVVEKAWNTSVRGSELVKLCKKQATTKDALRIWNRKIFGVCQNRINALMQNIKEVQNSTPQSIMAGQNRHNNVDALKVEDGRWITGSNQIRHAFLEHFKDLFREEEVSFPPYLEGLISPCISEEDNVNLSSIPTSEEIRSTLFHMQDPKALGPDGFLVLFYKEYWPIVGNDVISAVTSFFTLGSLPREVNSSLIVLIPKITNSSSVNHFRPISLCNVVYKVISKLLVAKMRPLMQKLISPCQSTFLPDRWIAENQVIVHEMLHSFKTKKVKTGLMTIKLDLQKAYDCVNWKFLHTVLSKFGFYEVFTNWILACVSSVSFEEVLSRILDYEFAQKNISGIKASIRGPSISHVMWSGQKINNNKSGVFFSKNTPSQNRRMIKGLLQMKGLKNDAIYLGSPLFRSRAPSKDFKFLQEKLESRLMGWRSRCLSWADRSTLIKSVVQALPNHTMSICSVPNTICDKLDTLTRRFWWKPREPEGRYLAWRSWDKLCQPKCKGGLGFRRAKDFNIALLAKLAWMIASNRDSLCMNLLRAKYKVKHTWFHSKLPKSASHTWKAIEKAKVIILQGACYLIGGGSSVSVWEDPWVPWIQGFSPKPREVAFSQIPMLVSQLINNELRYWNASLVNEIFDPESARAILSISLPFQPCPDKLIWVLDSKGKFTVKSAY